MKRSALKLAGAAVVGVMIATALAARSVPAVQRSWSVPGTRAGDVGTVQYSDNPVIPCRLVSFRSKFASLDKLGPLRIYPVVRAPSGHLYLGFVRNYPAGGVGDRFISWTFPSQFRAPGAQSEGEDQSNWGDCLAEGDPQDLKKLLPDGVYQAKWVINNRLIDTGDRFTYHYRELH